MLDVLNGFTLKLLGLKKCITIRVHNFFPNYFRWNVSLLDRCWRILPTRNDSSASGWPRSASRSCWTGCLCRSSATYRQPSSNCWRRSKIAVKLGAHDDQNQMKNLGKFKKRKKIIFTSMYYDVFREIYVLMTLKRRSTDSKTSRQLTYGIVPQFKYVTWYSWTRDELQESILNW